MTESNESDTICSVCGGDGINPFWIGASPFLVEFGDEFFYCNRCHGSGRVRSLPPEGSHQRVSQSGVLQALVFLRKNGCKVIVPQELAAECRRLGAWDDSIMIALDEHGQPMMAASQE